MRLTVQEIPSPVVQPPVDLPRGLLSMEMTPKFNPKGVVLSGMRSSGRVQVNLVATQADEKRREIVIALRTIEPQISPGTPNKAVTWQRAVVLPFVVILPGKWNIVVIDMDSPKPRKPILQQVINFA